MDRFYDKVSPEPNSGCWLWMAAEDGHGYGSFALDGKNPIKAYRASWKIHRGEIPDDMMVCHKCDTPACVNPDHLFLGDQTANMADAAAKDRTAHGTSNGRAKLTPQKVRTIRALNEHGWSQYSLAREFGVSRTTVQSLLDGRSWQRVQ